MEIEFRLLTASWEIGDLVAIDEVKPVSQNEVRIITAANGKKYVLKQQSSRERVQAEAALLGHIQEKLPLAAPIKTKDNSFFVHWDDKCYVLYPFLEGQSLSNHYDKERALLLGEAIGRLHSILAGVQVKGCRVMNLKKEVLSWSKGIIEQHKQHFNYCFVLEVIKNFAQEIDSVYDFLPTQIIHRDIHPGNLLFKGQELSGIVDFELSVRGVRIFDPCYCATSILVGDFDDEGKRDKWPGLFTALLTGYSKRIKLTDAEIRAILSVLYSIQFIFMAYSCTVDNIAAARCNERVLRWLFDNRGMLRYETGGIQL